MAKSSKAVIQCPMGLLLLNTCVPFTSIYELKEYQSRTRLKLTPVESYVLVGAILPKVLDI